MFTVASLSAGIGGSNSTTTSLSDACHPKIVSDEPTFDTERSTASSLSSENGFAIGLNRSVTSASIDRCLKSGVTSMARCKMSICRLGAYFRSETEISVGTDAAVLCRQ